MAPDLVEDRHHVLSRGAEIDRHFPARFMGQLVDPVAQRRGAVGRGKDESEGALAADLGRALALGGKRLDLEQTGCPLAVFRLEAEALADMGRPFVAAGDGEIGALLRPPGKKVGLRTGRPGGKTEDRGRYGAGGNDACADHESLATGYGLLGGLAHCWSSGMLSIREFAG